MDKIYEFQPDGDVFEHLLFKQTNFDVGQSVVDKLWGTARIGQVWDPFEVVINTEHPGPIADFPLLIGGPPIFSEKAWRTLEPLIGFEAEALPIIHPRGPHVAIHVLSLIDALDHAHSKFTRTQSGRIFEVDHHAWNQDVIKGHHIFKIPEKRLHVKISEDFRRMVETNTLTGLRFREL